MENPISLTLDLINKQPSIKALLELPQVEAQFVITYKKTTGLDDGPRKFEQEKLMFLQQASGTSLESCEKFSVYAAFIELAASGLTLRDGLAYIIPYGKKASFQPGWKGRLEQINQMMDVIYCPEPILIREGDFYDIEAGERLVIKHKPILGNQGKIVAVYLPVQMHHGVEFYMMSREDVMFIRDNYSEPYKAYVKALAKPVNKDRKVGDKLIIEYKDKVTKEIKTFEQDDLPMWVNNEGQAFKKTLVKRVYSAMPKLDHQKYLDERIAERIRASRMDVDEIPDEVTNKVNAIAAALELEQQANAPEPIPGLKPSEEFDTKNVLAPVVKPEPIAPVTAAPEVQTEAPQPTPQQQTAPAPATEQPPSNVAAEAAKSDDTAAPANDLFAGLGEGL